MDAFKKAEVRPLYKKIERQKNQTIGQLVFFRMFQNFMKVCLYDQIYCYFDKIFSIYQCGFCKRISTHYIL